MSPAEENKWEDAQVDARQVTRLVVLLCHSSEVAGANVPPRLAPRVGVRDGQDHIAARLARDDLNAVGEVASLGRLLNQLSGRVGVDLDPRLVVLDTLAGRLPLAVVPGHGRGPEVADRYPRLCRGSHKADASGLAQEESPPLLVRLAEDRTSGVWHDGVEAATPQLGVVLKKSEELGLPLRREAWTEEDAVVVATLASILLRLLLPTAVSSLCSARQHG